MAEGDNSTALLKAMLRELKKEYYVYNGSNQCTDIYQAPHDAENGAPCLRTQFEYDGSGNQTKSAESLSTWVSATMDI